MQHDPLITPAPDARLSGLARRAADLGFEIVEVSANLDRVDEIAARQRETIEEVTTTIDRLTGASARMAESMAAVTAETRVSLEQANAAEALITSNRTNAVDIGARARALADEMTEIRESLDAVTGSNAEISAIAAQVNILAINAKIEAARAGDAGRGFAVVAEAINELSARTARAAEVIGERISVMAERVLEMQASSGDVVDLAGDVADRAGSVHEAVRSVSEASAASATRADDLTRHQSAVAAAFEQFRAVFSTIGAGANTASATISEASKTMHRLTNHAEAMVQATVSLGGGTRDQPFIERVQADAARIGAAFEAALEKGEIKAAALFDHRYTPIPGTDPEQFMAPFTALADRLLPAIQEAALSLDPQVVFCAAVDVNGYLPTHNRKFSQPQRRDPVWNAAHARNRRMFDDRVGLKAGRNTAPFLLQVYRRDMGGGEYAMMKDASAPIMVNGRHWGGLRLAYRIP